MKVAIFTSHILWDTHYETELEIIQRHLDAGDEVSQYVCNGDMKGCDANMEYGFSRCVQCIAKRRHGRSLLSKEVKSLSYKLLTRSDISRINKFMTKLPSEIKAFKSLYFDNFDVGYAVASSIISHMVKPEPDFKLHRDLFETITRSALEVYLSFVNRLRLDGLDLLYIFNGRLSHVRASFRAAQAVGIPCWVHERGTTINKYGIYENHLPHDFRRMGEKMEAFWNSNEDEEFKEKVAADFFNKRRNGIPLAWISFTAKQKRGLLPDGFDPEKKNIMIFNSSEFEYAAIGPEWENSIYTNQNEGLLRICTDMEAHSDFHLYLRLHPNLATADPENYNIARQLKAKNLTVIMPDEPIDSYNLLDNAWKVLTFGSSMGIEATWWGKPSILAGHSLYECFNVAYKPKDHAELMNFILMPDLPPFDRKDARKFGYFNASYGLPYKYYVPADYKTGTYRGVQLASVMKNNEHRMMNVYWRFRRHAMVRAAMEYLIKRKLDD